MNKQIAVKEAEQRQYLNSSIFWLIREIAGRKNLGGGMLKAEAIDIKPFAILFDFKDVDAIRKLYTSTKGIEVLETQEEVYTEHHKQIDNLVFDYLGFSQSDREFVVNMLIKQIDARYSKTKAK